MTHCHCNDFARSRVATAGDGLPSIEPGMPTPAGTGMNRRSMLLRSLGVGVAVYGMGALTSAERVEAAINDALGEHKVVISVFFDGGMDALSLLAPTGDPNFQVLRPTLAGHIPGTAKAFQGDSKLSWNPAANSLSDLWDSPDVGVAVAPAIGYPDANYSHFTSRHFWEVGALDVGGTTGWMGRYLDQVGRSDVPIQGLTMGGSLSPVLATANVPVAAVWDVDGYNYQWPGAWGDMGDLATQYLRQNARTASADGQLATSRMVSESSFALVDELTAVSTTAAGSGYGTSGFAGHLSGIARLLDTRIAGNALPIRCIALSAEGGYDTHSAEYPDFGDNVQATCDAIKAFWADLKTRGQDDRVVMLLWSEFGRRPEENGSGGCDHGAAGTAFVIGKNVKQGLIGEFPGLQASGSTSSGLMDDGNLRATSDFRGVQSALLEQWLGVDAAGIIPGAGAKPGSGAFLRPALF